MDSSHDVLIRHPVPLRRLTRAEFRRMGEAGILGKGDRVELLEGQLVQMSPIGPRHSFVVDELVALLVPAVAGRARVRVQNPIALDDGSEPQPDIVLARPAPDGYRGEHPGPQDILLLIEVADSSRDFDSGAKREIYARAGIREFWIVDLVSDCVVVCRQPSGLAYGVVGRVERSGVLGVEALPGMAISVASLFG